MSNFKVGDRVIHSDSEKFPWVNEYKYAVVKELEEGSVTIDYYRKDGGVIENLTYSSRSLVLAPPKTWGEMTPAEKGELLLAHHEGQTIEWSDPRDREDTWDSESIVLWVDFMAYRIRSEVETVTMYGSVNRLFSGCRVGPDTHEITYDVIDGEPDCNSIKMRKL
jgi:hypothetical protein